MPKPLVLIIRDGWGVAPAGPGNAAARARTPHHDAYRRKYPHALLDASGETIGLPQGFHGNSEVGHLTIGAGRPVKQELTFIHEKIASGAFFRNKKLIRAFGACRKRNATLNLIGILQDAGVHAHETHLWALLTLAQQQHVARVVVHILADGRDSPPRSVQIFLKKLLTHFPNVTIGTLAGRYWLDRAGHWQLTETLYRALVFGEAHRVPTAAAAIDDAYRNRRTPDGRPMVDEFIPPYLIGQFKKIKAHDTVLFFNFRQDRMIQLTRAFVERRYGGPPVRFITLTRPYDEFQNYIFAPHEDAHALTPVLGEVLSMHHLRQLRLADSQKFRHVTSFLNGKRIAPFPGEDRMEINVGPSAQYRDYPFMGAKEIAAIAPLIIRHSVYDFIVVNFANCDMVGHVGNFALAVKTVSMVDRCVGALVDATLKAGGEAVVTADHGNIEQMHYNRNPHDICTAHSTNPVEFFYISTHPQGRLLPRGFLSSIAPTILDLFNIPTPSEMNGVSLLKRGKKFERHTKS
ncbi:MAG: 2,3-bisphosphoglycerate-independent phosphoglycerate mutase [Patescibacteria group bacterium]